MYDAKLVVYTCVTGSYDDLSGLQVPKEGIQFVLFTDRKIKKDIGWEVRPLASPVRLTNGHDINRYHKFFAHRIFPNNEYSIYQDGNINFEGSYIDLLLEFKKSEAALAAFKHPKGRSLLEEAEACKFHKNFDDFDKSKIIDQFNYYISKNIDLEKEITANYFLLRRHNHEKLSLAMSLWWSQLYEFTKRDQISLEYALEEAALPSVLIEDLGFNSNLLVRSSHKTKKEQLKKLLKNIGFHRGV